MIPLFFLLLTLSTLASTSASLYPSELPWTQIDNYGFITPPTGMPLVKPPDARLFRADKAILVAPLGFENGRLRAFVCTYRASELPLPEGTQILRVLVPDRVEHVHVKVDPEFSYFPESAILSIPKEFDRPLPLGPWHEVRYSVERKDGLLLVRPSRTVEGIFAVEALLPTRGRWARVALTPGSWLVQLGWTIPFDIIRLSDGWVIFQGVPPYDEMQYDLGDVKIVFWVCGYFVDLKGRRWIKDWIAKFGIVNVLELVDKIAESEGWYSTIDFDVQDVQKKLKSVYGSGLIIRISNKVSIILEFRVIRVWPIYTLGTFYSQKYLENHHYPSIPAMLILVYHAYQSLPLLLTLPVPRRRKARRSGESSVIREIMPAILLSISILASGAGATPIDDCLKLQKTVVSRIDTVHGKLDTLLKKLGECEGKGVDLSGEKHDVRLSMGYLEEAKEVLSRNEANLEWLKSKYESIKDGDRRERFLAEVMDGGNGLSGCFHALHEIGRKLDEVEGIVDDALRLCERFLKGELNADEFKKELDDTLTRGGGIVANSGDVKEAAYTVDRATNASVARASDLLKEWSREDESKSELKRLRTRLEGLRSWVIGGLTLSLLAGAAVGLAPQDLRTTLLQVLSAITEVLSVMLQLVGALKALVPVPGILTG